VKRDLTEPIIYAFLLSVLLGYRIFAKLRETGIRPVTGSRA
jgi:hypothetical protein